MRPFAPLLLAAAPLAAQVVPAATSLGISLQAGAATPASVAAGLPVTNGIALGIAAPSATAQFAAGALATSAAVDLDWTFGCSAHGAATAGSHGAIRYELWAAQPVSGVLVVSFAATPNGTGSATCAIDVGDDNVIDATGPAVLSVGFGPGPLLLRVQATAVAYAGTVAGPWGTQWSYSGAVNAALRVRLVPTHCQAAPLAPACGDPQLTVAGNLAGGADLLGAFGPAVGLGVAVLGLDQQPFALPLAPGCTLATTPLATLWQALGPSRTAAWSLSFPGAARPLGFAAQLVGLDVATSQATVSPAFWIGLQ